MANSLNAQLRVSTEEELTAKLTEAKEELFKPALPGSHRTAGEPRQAPCGPQGNRPLSTR